MTDKEQSYEVQKSSRPQCRDLVLSEILPAGGEDFADSRQISERVWGFKISPSVGMTKTKFFILPNTCCYHHGAA